MTKVAAMWFVIASCAWAPVLAQSMGRLDLSSDNQGSSCNIVDATPGPVYVHMLITNVTGVTAVQFAAPTPPCWLGATWIGDNTPFFRFGDTQMTDPRGLQLTFYGECLNSPIYLGAIVFWTQGRGLSCCSYPVVKALDDGYPEIPGPIIQLCYSGPPADIAGVIAGQAIINPEPHCDCNHPVAVEQTTWGAIKEVFH